MKTSQDRILTTHVGSLPRTQAVLDVLERHETRADIAEPAFDPVVQQAVVDNVRRQREVGIDIVSDGEASKISYATYVKDRLTGFSESGATEASRPHLDLAPFPDYRQKMTLLSGKRRFKRVSCIGPVVPQPTGALEQDLQNMRRAVSASGPTEAFLNAASPGVVASFLPNEYYPSYHAYVEAIADAMRPEYEAIAAAGFIVQVDCPDLAMSRHATFQDLSEAEFLDRYRRNMISQCGIAIFISGTSRSNVVSSGVMDEYRISRLLKKTPIPIGATGFAAQAIWKEVKNDFDAVYGGAVPMSLFERLNDRSLKNTEILSAVFEIIDRVGKH